MLIDDQFNSSFFLLFQEGLVPISIPQFSDLPSVPTGEFGEVACYSCDAVHIPRPAGSASGTKASARSVTDVTGGEFRRKGDLVVLGLLKGLDHEVGQGRLRGFRFA
jgi:hypothetical protein